MTVLKALEVHNKYGYSYYDSLMIASALESN
jgi:predicted nucleic acid-binding protein